MTPNPAPNEPVARYATVVAKTPTQRSYSHLTNPDDLLGELFADLFYKRTHSALTRWWLKKGILNAIRMNVSLDKGLSLAGDGLQQRLLKIRRNRYLADAIRATALDESVSDWQRCLRLVPEIKRFMRTWPVTRKLSEPPADWSTVRRCLWRAASTKISLPESADSLYRVLAQMPRHPCKNSGAKLLETFL